MSSDSTEAQEARRLAALRRYQILDTPPDGNFDGITHLAAKLLKVPIALTTLVDTDRIWFASKHGVEIDEIGRDPGLCASAILDSEVYVVNDAKFDPRTLVNPLVASEFGLRFYAAVPLRTHDDFNLGTLCVIDREPREISKDELGILQTLGELVMDQMELRLASRKVDEANRKLARLIEEKERFLEMASHELRDPLTTVMIFSKLLEEQKVGPLNSRQEEMISEVFQSSQIMLKHVKSYLDRTVIEEPPAE